MIHIGNPNYTNANLLAAINRIELKVRPSDVGIVEVLLNELSPSCSLLDIGQSLRHNTEITKSICELYRTLDLNQFDNYPDYLADICDPNLLVDLKERFDFVTCFSLLEHTYQPFLASQNLIGLVKKGGKIFGSAPFLYPRHSPTDLSYQDYFRFTRDAYAVLFPNVESINLYPMRGRLATSLLIFSSRYKTVIERKYPRITRWLNSRLLNGEQLLQTSGYEFIITV